MIRTVIKIYFIDLPKELMDDQNMSNNVFKIQDEHLAKQLQVTLKISQNKLLEFTNSCPYRYLVPCCAVKVKKAKIYIFYNF